MVGERGEVESDDRIDVVASADSLSRGRHPVSVCCNIVRRAGCIRQVGMHLLSQLSVLETDKFTLRLLY